MCIRNLNIKLWGRKRIESFTKVYKMSEVEDIIFGIKLLNQFCRFDESIRMMDNFLEMKQDLDKTERQIFFVVYKAAIDNSRRSFRTIDGYYQQCVADAIPGRAEKLQEYKITTGNKIIGYAQKAISIIKDVLMDQAVDPSARAFYYKITGDLYRYIAETSDLVQKNFGTVEGKQAYLSAIEICEQSLSPVDPVRLGTILNAAVFRYEHLKEKGEAIQMIQSAIQDVNSNQEAINKEDEEEISLALETMERNLDIWQTDECLEEEDH